MQNEGIAFGDNFKYIPKEHQNFAFVCDHVTVKNTYFRYHIAIPFQKEEPIMTVKSNSEKLGQGVGFERIRRITGYLVGTMDKWNDAKRAEERDRVKHGLNGNA